MTNTELREKLVKLLESAESAVYWSSEDKNFIEKIADHFLANGVTINQWIPVTERLPEPNKWVLCACRANIIEVLRYDNTTDDWDTSIPNRCYMKGFVTHWMPLPEPPEEE